nr:hypothetical protein [Tanacetum cinerariifolium]
TLPSTNLESNKLVLSSTGVNLVFSANESLSQDNTKNNRIRQTQKNAKKNKVEDHLRTVKSSLNKVSDVDSKATSSVLNSVNSDLKCVSRNGYLFSHNHDACAIDYINSVNELFTSFNQCLIDEVTEVQNVFMQMKLAVEQHCEEKSKVQTKMENVLQENDRLLKQALSVEIVNIVVHENMKSVCLNVTACARCVTTETELKMDFLNNECYDIDTWSSQESAPTFAELFKINNLKARAQEKDIVILKLKEKLNSFNGDVKDRHVKRDVEKSETLNIELHHKEKVLVITALKEQLDKLKGKAVITEAVSLNPINPELLKVDVTPVVPKLRQNRTAHTDYIRHTQEEAATLRKIVESEKLLSPLNTSLDYAYKYTRRI